MTDQKIDTLKDNNPIFKVARKIGLKLPNKDSGTVSIKCLFHEPDKHPSMVLMSDANRYECKSCGEKGDIIDLVKKAKGLSFKEAVSWLDSSFEFKKQYTNSTEYLSIERGISKETQRRFNLVAQKNRIIIPLETGEKYRWLLGKIRYSQKKGTKAELFKTIEAKDFVILGEGEFDAMLTWQETGHPIWTSTTGVETLRNEWLSEFENFKKIYIAFDADEAGDEWAERQAEKLGKNRCFRLRPTDGKDWTDYFVAHKKTKADFEKLLNSASPIVDSSEKQSIYIPNALEFLKQDFGEEDWLIKDLIPVGGRAVIVAKRESFKTWLALYICECVIQGTQIWEMLETTKNNVLYISNDDPAKSFQKRLKNFAFNESLYVYYSGLPKFTIDQKKDSFKSVKKLIKKRKIGLVVIDILRNIHSGDSNTDKDSMAVMNSLDELRKSDPNLTFIFLVHPSKEDSRGFKKRTKEEAVGSYYWEATVDTVISLIRTTDEELTDKVKIEVTKNKQSDKRIQPFIGIRKEKDGKVQFVNEEFIPEKTKREEAVEAIPLFLKDNKGAVRKAIIEFLTSSGTCSKRTAESAITDCKKKKLIKHTTSRPYSYFLSEDFPQTADIYTEHGIAE